MDVKNEATKHNGFNTGTNSWGYMVCFGMFMTFITGIGFISSFGLIYKDFINEKRASAKSLTSAHGVFSIMLAIGGIILNILSKHISLRSGGLIGSVLLVSGTFSTVFITSIEQLSVTFGVLQGLGFGIMASVCYSTFNYYFSEKKTTFMSLTKAAQSIICILYPQLLKNLIYYFGFRGTLLIQCAISLHTIPGMLTMVKPKVKAKASDALERGKDSGEVNELLNDTSSNIESKVERNLQKKGKTNKRFNLLEILNFAVLKDVVFCNLCLGQSFVNFSDLMFFLLQPMLLFQYGFDNSQVAACISICAGADVAGRIALAAISSLIAVNTRMLYYFSALLTLVLRLAILQVNNYLWIVLQTAALGVLKAFLHISSPLVISNHVSHDQFPGAYALFTLASGLVNVGISPLIGTLKDVWSDYVPAFYALAACCLPCVVLWPLEYIFGKK